MYGHPRIVLAPGPLAMQVPDELRKCVAFAAYETAARFSVGGTVFFVSQKVTADRSVVYAVTARHVIEEIGKRAIDPKVMHVRVNPREGSANFSRIPIESWVFHPDGSDVAVALIGGFDGVDHKALPRETFGTKDVVEKEQIGIGDELIMVGLYRKHYGDKRNVPIVRVGNIAAMPEDPVRTKMGLMDAYLAEVRSIGGLSGSPVFAHFGYIRYPKGEPTGKKLGVHDLNWYVQPRCMLLGLMHGHWDIPNIADEPDSDFLEAERINTGIAVVIPADKIADVLDCPQFVANRELTRKHIEAEDAPEMDATGEP